MVADATNVCSSSNLRYQVLTVAIPGFASLLDRDTLTSRPERSLQHTKIAATPATNISADLILRYPKQLAPWPRWFSLAIVIESGRNLQTTCLEAYTSNFGAIGRRRYLSRRLLDCCSARLSPVPKRCLALSNAWIWKSRVSLRLGTWFVLTNLQSFYGFPLQRTASSYVTKPW